MRYLLLDRILELRPGKFARGLRNVTMTEDVFATHFPNFPILPGVLITDTMVEVAALGAASARKLGVKARLVRLKEAKFRRYVRPGDQLIVQASLQEDGSGQDTGRECWQAKAFVNGKLVASIGSLEFALDLLEPEAIAREYRRFYSSGGSLHDLEQV